MTILQVGIFSAVATAVLVLVVAMSSIRMPFDMIFARCLVTAVGGALVTLSMALILFLERP